MNNQAQTFTPNQPTPQPTATPLAFGTQPPITNTIGYNVAPPDANKAKGSGRIKLIALIIVSILAIVFLGLFIWAFSNYSSTKSDVDGQITKAVALAVNEKATELEADFAEREKSPYLTFAAPEDYGSLTFQYPKTWSSYIAKDASSGGNFESYFNPGSVNPIGNESIYALRANILTQAYDNVIKTYESRVKSGKMTLEVRTVGGENANVYSGELPNGKLVGTVAIFPIRDKTVVLQTDASVFLGDFNYILETVSYAK